MVIPQILQALKPLGFYRQEPQGASDYLELEGALDTRFGSVPCEVLIDRKLRSFPQIFLKAPLPSQLLPVAPHIGADGFLCYVAEETVVFDLYKPVSQTIASLKRAATVLDQIMAGERIDDLEEEFFAFWRGDYCYTDLANLNSEDVVLLSLGSGQGFVLTDDVERTGAKFSHRSGKVRSYLNLASKIVTKVRPRPAIGSWPPTTVSELLYWQSKLDHPCCQKILDRIVRAYRAGREEVLILVHAPSQQYGFFVRNLQKYKRASKLDQRIPIFDAPIETIQVVRMDDRHIVERNIPGCKTLADKKVALVGCGTIGGYLADLLVRAGAGTGAGELLLIDNQTLAPGNIGRHRLGVNRLEKNKAEGLQSELKTAMPSANVRALSQDAFTVGFVAFDLVIDATGEQGFGNWLAGQQASGFMLKNGEPTRLLHVWIEGEGEAVRTLFKRLPSEGCFRCLCDYELEQQFLSVAGGVRAILAGAGCEGRYVAYPASVSVQAAALAFDAVLAWVNTTPWASLSTRVIDQLSVALNGDLTMLPRPGCPACSL
ncbi:ThiF family adenylyltransferase [Pseudomonas syringae group genomosp. 3]|uniref:ThiF family adenylyltransferase n=1 Tax=Pseudomonas syringae group genomosp. 3 TaxID=251701 RepID=UPI000A4BF75C|nr:ThiF family adenylyltransferase [Pseudomonas syringae group genomosp. 3]